MHRRGRGALQASRPRSRAQAVLPVVGVMTGLGLILAGAAYATQPHYRVPTSTGTVPLATPASASALGSSSAAATPGQAGPTAKLRPGHRPTSLSLPALHVAARIASVTAANRELGVPDDPAVIGWWAAGAAPGASTGTVVLDGHVDTAEKGAGALFHLEDSKPGDRVVVNTKAGSVTYRVVARHTYRKTALPTDIFTASGRPRLVLITCGGPFDAKTRHYEDNVVVYALPVS